MFTFSSNGKGIIFGPQLKRHYGANGIYPALWFIGSMEKAWFYERFFFEVVMAMVKYVKKKKYNKGYNVKEISFMHYLK